MEKVFLPCNETSDWQTIEKKVVYDNPWITVEHHDVITPGQTQGIYGLVKFKNKAIGVVPVDEAGNVYLVGQYRYPLSAYSWEIPEGGGPHEEDPLLAAQRELKEETGLYAHQWEVLGKIHTSNSVTDEEGLIFLARALEESIMEPEATEALSVEKVPLKDAVQWVMEGKITDSLSMVGILMAARCLGM